MKEKTIVVVGHIDHGKSTLLGRLLYDTKNISNVKIQDVQGVKGNINFAHLLDAFIEEQEKNKTINAMRIAVEINKQKYVFFDVPGHKEFIDRMITSAFGVHSAILVVDVIESVQSQTKKHLAILALFGVREIIIVVNKMDVIDYNKSKFETMVREVEQLCTDNDLIVKNIIPISAQNGWNVMHKYENCIWYHGKTLVQELTILQKDIDIKNNENIIISIQDVYEFNKKKQIVGKLIGGEIEANILPVIVQNIIKSKKYKLQSIKDVSSVIMKHVLLNDVVTLDFEDATNINRGDLLMQKIDAIQYSKKIDAKILWIDDNYQKNQEYTITVLNQKTKGKIFFNKNIEVSVDMRGRIFDACLKIDNKIIWCSFDKNIFLGLCTISSDNKIIAVGVL